MEVAPKIIQHRFGNNLPETLTVCYLKNKTEVILILFLYNVPNFLTDF